MTFSFKTEKPKKKKKTEKPQLNGKVNFNKLIAQSVFTLSGVNTELLITFLRHSESGDAKI